MRARADDDDQHNESERRASTSALAAPPRARDRDRSRALAAVEYASLARRGQQRFGRAAQHRTLAGRGFPVDVTIASAPAGWAGGLWPAVDEYNERECDWGSFLDAYAAGFWDPHRQPLQPTAGAAASFPFPTVPRSSAGDDGQQRLLRSHTYKDLSEAGSTGSSDGREHFSKGPSSDTTPSSTASSSLAVYAPVMPSPLKGSLAERRGAQAPDLSHSMPTRAPTVRSGGDSPFSPYAYAHGRPRLKASNSSPGILLDAEPVTQEHDPETVSTRAAVAATMRWAGVGVSIAPLALPSPEHELTDPMRNFNKSLPPPTPRDERGELPSPRKRAASIVSSSASDRDKVASKLRDRGFWEGTQEVSPEQLPPVPGSTGATPESDANVPSLAPGKRISTERDYFSLVPPPPPRAIRNAGADADAGDTSDPSSPSASVYETPAAWETPAIHGPGGTHPTASMTRPFTVAPMTALKLPAIPSPASSVTPEEPELSRGSRSTSDDSGQTIAARSPPVRPALGPRSLTTFRLNDPVWTPDVTESPPVPVRSSDNSLSLEESTFRERGFLRAPIPPNETARQRALYRYNIMHTGPDPNFERLVHLVKLVFNTKMVILSLLDATEQWYKSSSGLDRQSTSREVALCAHAILQRSREIHSQVFLRQRSDDEPLVVLDTQTDWRFRNNPLVTNSPHFRFYAGAPLRTHDGHNIGTLALADDQPLPEFSPRQRHTLREFAGVVMREIELWKDKIQLRIRGRIQTSMEQFTRECLEIDTESARDSSQTSISTSSMDNIYDRAVKLVKRTLDVEGVMVMDVSHADVTDILPPQDVSPAGHMSLVVHSAGPGVATTTKSLSATEYARINEFFYKNPDGKVVESVVPHAFRGLIPSNIKYALVVPVFDVDKRPFALLCAYNTTHGEKPFLEGHELSYLRAIGVIILSAVLKRRMTLADKAKSMFISNVSHELRTPLHGILAAAELLQDTLLDQHQASILQTVQACGTSLVETVNHVLDFTKLSGSTKAGGTETAIAPTRVDLMQLVEEAVEGCWIGYRARASALQESDIGSVYSPPDRTSPRDATRISHVETVVDIDLRPEGWTVKCEKGGIRRVLMNLIGNSLKFTSDGSVHIVLRELHGGCNTPGKIRIELGVLDSGKGISKEFLKNQLFHPFSQENPLQTGTGLGLAIVNSIIHSKSVDGSVDVWSAEGLGTEIRVAMDIEAVQDAPPEIDAEPWALNLDGKPFSVSLTGFNQSLRGELLLRNTIEKYLQTWWGFTVLSGDSITNGDIILVNEDPLIVERLLNEGRVEQPVVVLSSYRGDSTLVNVVNSYEQAGGFCRIVYKPGGPSRLRNVFKQCVDALNYESYESPDGPSILEHRASLDQSAASLMRRRSDEVTRSTPRPQLNIRSTTYHPNRSSPAPQMSPPIPRAVHRSISQPRIATPDAPARKKPPGGASDSWIRRVLIIEDNSLLRDLLVRWATTKGYEHHEAFDGVQGVQQVESSSETFDVILLDVSMPNMDGIAATRRIRDIEASRRDQSPSSSLASRASIIVALTGMSSSEDRTRAFQAGVNGYLVKPVSFKFLDSVLHDLRGTASLSPQS